LRVSLAGKKDYEQPVVVAPGQRALFDVTLADAERPSLPPPFATPRPGVSVFQPAPVDPALVAKQMETRRHSMQAAEFLRNRQYADAASEYRAAIQLDPQNADLHINLGTALGQQGDRDGQIAEDREAVRLNPNNDRAHNILASALSQAGDWDGVIVEYTEVVRLHPTSYTAHYSLGMAYEHKGDQQAALQEYRRAYDLGPNIPTYRLAYERLLQQINR
jgi:tetratricopeptide (TPR) repeat protein